MARTSEFDRDDVVTNAMNTFWELGYNKTSIPNLTKATHLQPGSIYAAFKSKEGLFQATLEHYSQCGLGQIHELIETSTTPLEGVVRVIESIVEEVMADDQQRGCYLVNSLLELAPQNEKIQDQINQHLDAVESELLTALQSAHNSGELPAEKDPAALAKFLMVNIWGLRVLAKTRPDRDQVKAVCEQLVLNVKA